MARRRLCFGWCIVWQILLAASIPQIQINVSVIEEILAPNSLIKDIMDDPRVKAQLDTSDVSRIHFRYLSAEPVGFSVDSSGLLRTTAWIDRDQLCPNKAVCQVEFDLAIQPARYFTLVKVIINIRDLNDNTPVFARSEISHVFSESTRVGTSFVLPDVTDPDSPQYSIRRIFLRPSASDQFELATKNKPDGRMELRLVLKSSLDRETIPEYRLQVVALDGGDPGQSGTLNVTIIVADANDNHPIFDMDTYEVTIPENVPSGYVVLTIHATDLDAGLNSQIIYTWSADTMISLGSVFKLDNHTGQVTVKGLVDYEEASVMYLTAEARDRGADPIPAAALIIIHVLDVNDHAPEILVHTLGGPGVQEATVLEGAATGTFVARVVVSDKDSGDNGRYNCSLREERFVLDPLGADFLVTTRGQLDRERRAMYNLAINCWDYGLESLDSITNIRVIIEDVNDNSPVFTKTSYVTQIVENNHPDTILIQISASDPDEGSNAEISYGIQGAESEKFVIERHTGVVRAMARLDREQESRHDILITASDNGDISRTASTVLTVHVIDTNDEKPRFSKYSYQFRVYENQDPDTGVGVLYAEDPDSPEFARHTFRLEAVDPDAALPFAIGIESGRIVTTASLDREARDFYRMTAVVQDTSDPFFTSTAKVSVFVLDRNDNSPKFVFPSEDNNTIRLGSNVPLGYTVTRVRAEDKDAERNGKIRYELLKSADDYSDGEQFFVLDALTGAISVASALQHLDNVTFALTLKASDEGLVVMSSSATLYITVSERYSVLVSEADSDLMTSNVVIVVIVACVSGIVAVILILAILVICQKRRHDNREEQQYKCNAESLKALADKEASEASDESEAKRKDKSAPRTRCAVPDSVGERTRELNRALSDRNQHQEHWLNSNKSDKNSHPVIVKIDPDADSIKSGKGSNADSGRGSSEQGDLVSRPSNAEGFIQVFQKDVPYSDRVRSGLQTSLKTFRAKPTRAQSCLRTAAAADVDPKQPRQPTTGLHGAPAIRVQSPSGSRTSLASDAPSDGQSGQREPMTLARLHGDAGRSGLAHRQHPYTSAHGYHGDGPEISASCHHDNAVKVNKKPLYCSVNKDSNTFVTLTTVGNVRQKTDDQYGIITHIEDGIKVTDIIV